MQPGASRVEIRSAGKRAYDLEEVEQRHHDGGRSDLAVHAVGERAEHTDEIAGLNTYVYEKAHEHETARRRCERASLGKNTVEHRGSLDSSDGAGRERTRCARYGS